VIDLGGIGQRDEPLAAAQIRRLVMLRWLSVVVMLTSALLLPRWLGLSVSVGPPLSVAFALAAANLFTLAGLRGAIFRSQVWVFLQLMFDVLGWSAFVYFTGGATNPLISLLLPLLAIGAAVLPAPFAWILAACGVAAYSLLWQFHHPIRLADAQLAAQWHLSGMWITFALSAVVMVGFVLRMTAALRDRDRALAQVAAERARDERVVALANLAAGAAHSLGTPLGTIRLLSDELLQTRGLDAELRGDIELIGEQVDHCRRTLALLTARAGSRRAEGGGRIGARQWVQQVVEQWQVQRPRARASLVCAANLDGLEVVGDETLAQSIQTLVNNAADACSDVVEVCARVDGERLVIEVSDRGPGIPDAIDTGAGDAMTGDGGAGMGIGLFLARAAIARVGGVLAHELRSGGGTLARIELPLERMRA